MTQHKTVHLYTRQSSRGGRQKKEREGFVFGQDKRIMQDTQQYALAYTPSYAPVPANMPGTHKAADGVRCQSQDGIQEQDWVWTQR